MPRKKDVAGLAMQSVLSQAAGSGWRSVTLLSVAEDTGLPVADVAAAIGSCAGALRELSRRTDAAMLEAVDEDWDDESIRERLFTLLMARFDHLRPHREALRAVLADAPRDPLTFLRLAHGSGLRSMALILEAAGLPVRGFTGEARKRALAVAYAMAIRAFLADDSDDLSATMATVDRQLANLERLAARFNGGPRFQKPAEESAASDA